MKNIFLIGMSCFLVLSLISCSSNDAIEKKEIVKEKEVDVINEEISTNFNVKSEDISKENVKYVIEKIDIKSNTDDGNSSVKDIRKIKNDDLFVDIFNDLLDEATFYYLATDISLEFVEKSDEIPNYLIASKEEIASVWFDDDKTYLTINNIELYELVGDDSNDFQNLIKGDISPEIALNNYEERNKVNKDKISDNELEGLNEITKELLQIYKTGVFLNFDEEIILKSFENTKNHISKFYVNKDIALIQYVDEENNEKSIPMLIEYDGNESVFGINIGMKFLEVKEKLDEPIFEDKSSDGYIISYEFYDSFGFDNLTLTLILDSIDKNEESLVSRIELFNWDQYKKSFDVTNQYEIDYTYYDDSLDFGYIEIGKDKKEYSYEIYNNNSDDEISLKIIMDFIKDNIVVDTVDYNNVFRPNSRNYISLESSAEFDNINVKVIEITGVE